LLSQHIVATGISTMAIACECAKATNLELQDATINMNTDVECTKATNLELKVMLVLLNASDEWQWKL
jgi:hypothetical protein